MLTSVRFVFQRNIGMSNQHVFPSLVSAIGCLTQDYVIRHNLAHDPNCWTAFLIAIVSIITDQYPFGEMLQTAFSLGLIWIPHCMYVIKKSLNEV